MSPTQRRNETLATRALRVTPLVLADWAKDRIVTAAVQLAVAIETNGNVELYRLALRSRISEYREYQRISGLPHQ